VISKDQNWFGVNTLAASHKVQGMAAKSDVNETDQWRFLGAIEMTVITCHVAQRAMYFSTSFTAPDHCSLFLASPLLHSF
jgi:hypothetical protein